MRITMLLIVCTVATAHAESPADRTAHAAKLFEEGRDFAKVARYAEACDRFAKSYELDPASGTAVNFADCEEHLGHLARASELFERAAAPPNDNAVRAQYARDRAAALLPRLGTVVVTIADPRIDQLAVTIGGHRIATAAEIHERVDPGDVEVVIAAPERRFAKTVHATAGATTTVDVPVLDRAARGRDDARGDKRRSWVLGAELAGGAGVISLVASGVFAVSASRYYHDAFTHGQCFYTAAGDRCTPEGLATVASAHDRANVATITFVAGAALAATGVALYVMAPRDTAIEVSPTATASSAGVAISGRF